MVEIIASNRNTEEEIFHEVMDIEAEVYTDDMRGDYQSIQSIKGRFNKYPEMFFLACEDGKIVGYFCFFPICQKLYEEIVHMGYFRDDDIKPEDIVSIETAKHIYIFSVAVYKKYQDTGLADEMMKQFEMFIDKCKEEGSQIENVIATTVTDDGEKFAKKYGFNLHLDRRQEGFKIYLKELKDEH